MDNNGVMEKEKPPAPAQWREVWGLQRWSAKGENILQKPRILNDDREL